MAIDQRMEKIRKARSLNDILDILREISADVRSGSDAAERLAVSLSADESLTINHFGNKPRTTRISTKNIGKKVVFSTQLKDFKAPKVDAIAKQLGIVHALHENARELNSIESLLRLSDSFKGAKNVGAAVRGVTALRKEVNASVNKAMLALSKIATKHLPSSMKKMRDGLTADLLDSLSSSAYDNMTYREYVSTDDNGDLTFSVYVRITNLKNSKRYTFKDYYIILSGVVSVDGRIRYYVNALPEFKAPGLYDLGEPVKDNTDLKTTVARMLAHNDVASHLNQLAIDLDKNTIENSGLKRIAGVKRVLVKDNKVILVLDDNLAAARREEVVKRGLVLLSRLVNKRKTTNIMWRATKNTLEFYFTSSMADKSSLTIARLSEMRDALDLTDEQVQALKRSSAR